MSQKHRSIPIQESFIVKEQQFQENPSLQLQQYTLEVN